MLLFVCSCYSQNVTLSSNGSLTLFPIQPGARGADIINMFNTLNSAPLKLPQSQIAIQTTRNGLITNVQFITPMANLTILVVGYWLPNDSPPPNGVGGRLNSPNRFGYVALPVEQIVEVIYSPIIMSSSFTFTSYALGGTLPIFSVDMAQRSADIIQAVTLLNHPPIANQSTFVAYPPVSLQTTVNGPFYGETSPSNQVIVNGIISRIVSITPATPGSTLLLVKFKPLKANNIHLASGEIATVVIAPDQVSGIMFIQQ